MDRKSSRMQRAKGIASSFVEEPITNTHDINGQAIARYWDIHYLQKFKNPA